MTRGSFHSWRLLGIRDWAMLWAFSVVGHMFGENSHSDVVHSV